MQTTTGRRIRNAFIAVGGGVLALLIAYLVGRLQGLGDVRGAEERAERTKARLSGELDELRGRVGDLRVRVFRLAARRKLDQALESLDERNFGTADDALKEAARLLRSSGVALESDLARLTEDIAKTNVVAAEDFGMQRQHIQTLIDRLDALIPKTEPM